MGPKSYILYHSVDKGMAKFLSKLESDRNYFRLCGPRGKVKNITYAITNEILLNNIQSLFLGLSIVNLCLCISYLGTLILLSCFVKTITP